MTANPKQAQSAPIAYPFGAIVAQEDMKQALILTAIDPTIGGVMIFGDRGTGKTTAIRALASLLPKIEVVEGDPYNSAPEPNTTGPNTKGQQTSVPVVDLPLGASEDRVLGALDIERALVDGEKQFEPGLLARANRGYLYVDEINLLEDHIVDVLLDVAVSGENIVEREGLSIRHPAKFVLVGSGNPEEGELRPQLLDRFGLSVEVKTPTDIEQRIEVIKRRDAFEQDRAGFVKKYNRAEGTVRRKILSARELLGSVVLTDEALTFAAALCIKLGTDGLRGELALIRAARAQVAWKARTEVTANDIEAVAVMVLGHRLRRDPLDDARNETRVQRAIEAVKAQDQAQSAA